MGPILSIIVLVQLFGGGCYAHPTYGLPGPSGVLGLVWLFDGVRL